MDQQKIKTAQNLILHVMIFFSHKKQKDNEKGNLSYLYNVIIHNFVRGKFDSKS